MIRIHHTPPHTVNSFIFELNNSAYFIAEPYLDITSWNLELQIPSSETLEPTASSTNCHTTYTSQTFHLISFLLWHSTLTFLPHTAQSAPLFLPKFLPKRGPSPPQQFLTPPTTTTYKKVHSFHIYTQRSNSPYLTHSICHFCPLVHSIQHISLTS